MIHCKLVTKVSRAALVIAFINYNIHTCRDTTVQTLTLQPSVQDGRIMYQDSPLV